MKTVDISIIVPVYNVKDYLSRCVDSLLAQTYKDYEIILIDDGSNDGSEKLCEKWISFPNIHVVHQSNQGLSAARNTGLRISSGEYILFVDSDDYIEKDTCLRLIEEAKRNNCDIVCADAYRVTNSGIFEKNRDRKNIVVPCRGEDFLVESVKQKSMCMCAPFGLYRRDMIIDNQHWFKEGILHEDELWTPQTYLLADIVSYVPYRFYYHWERQGSINQSRWNKKRGQDVHYICQELAQVFYKKIKEKNKREILLDHVCMLYLNSLNMTQDYFGDKKFIIKTAHSSKNRIKAILYKISPRLYFALNPHKSVSK